MDYNRRTALVDAAFAVCHYCRETGMFPKKMVGSTYHHEIDGTMQICMAGQIVEMIRGEYCDLGRTIPLTNIDALSKSISGAIIQTYHSHADENGRLDKRFVGSMTKRIIGQLKTLSRNVE